jgi:hypothetical protein
MRQSGRARSADLLCRKRFRSNAPRSFLTSAFGPVVRDFISAGLPFSLGARPPIDNNVGAIADAAGLAPRCLVFHDRFVSSNSINSTSASSRQARFEVAFAPKAPLRPSSLKKHGENRRKSGGKWRRMALFRGSRAPFRLALGRSRSVATLAPVRSYIH